MPIDVVAWMREAQRAELMDRSGELLPELRRVSFKDAAGLKETIRTFIDDAPARQSLARLQRESVQHRLSYTAGLRRVLARVGRLLAESTAESAPRQAESRTHASASVSTAA